METISLDRATWQYEPSQPLGPAGGFGEVYAGQGVAGEPVAVKRLHMSAAHLGNRELQMAEILADRELPHIVPVLDAGVDEASGAYFIVMARADRSLAQEIGSRGSFCDDDAILVLREVVEGLIEVSEIVHRDLKPANVLLHEDKWKLADFGIARFVEAATSENTLRGCLTPEYAAPEQWMGERATHKTDVYALGCICHALLTGRPPYAGSREELREQHLSARVPRIQGVDAALNSLASMMLRRVADTRPSLDRIRTQLASLAHPRTDSPAAARLAEAGVRVAENEAEQVALLASDLEALDRRERIARSAAEILSSIRDDLVDRIITAAPTARYDGARSEITLGQAVLEFRVPADPEAVPEDAFTRSGWDVMLGSRIAVTQYENPRYHWSASLWYTNRGEGDEFRWWQCCYMMHPMSGRTVAHEPFALSDYERADAAAASGMAAEQFAAQPRPVDDEDIESFLDEWLQRLALASEGGLTRPRYLPIG